MKGGENKIMLRNYLKVAMRNIVRGRLNSALNIAGLSIGIACSLLMIMHVRQEMNWESGFPKADRIFRLTNQGLTGDARHWAVVSPLHGLEIRQDIPEIEQTTRLYTMFSNILAWIPEGGAPRRFQEEGGFYADPATISMFDLEFLKGDPETALDEVNTVILTESLASKYFGDEEPIAKLLRNERSNTAYRVTGVIADFDFHTHMRFDFLVSMETFYKEMIDNGARDWLEARGWAHFYTYCMLGPNIPLEQAEAKLPGFTANFYRDFGTREEILEQTRLHFQPVSAIHLYSHLEQEMGPNSDISHVYIFFAIALFLLVIAGVNFVNISTAQAFKRMKEIGVRKVMGAGRWQLVRQFLGESAMLTVGAALLSLGLFQAAAPLYNRLSGYSLSLARILTPANIGGLLVLVVLLSFAAGLYPALFMAGFRPSDTFRGVRDPGSAAARVRKGLLVFQFVISIFMIFCTITIWRQMRFFQNEDLGFDKEGLLVVELYGDLRRNTDALKTEMRGHSAVSLAGMASNLPGERLSVENLRPQGVEDDTQLPSMRYLRVDEDYIETMKMEITRGRSFKGLTRTTPAFILNEAAVAALQLENPVGKTAENFRGVRAEIIGVVKNFHFNSFHHAVEPLVLDFRPVACEHLFLRVQKNRIPDVIRFVQTRLGEVAPANLFLYTFVDDEWNRLYLSESRMNDIFQAFSLLAIVISCLGLFGLSAYAAQTRTKEIGVRKVLGANGFQLVTLLSRDFALWVLLANLVAWPLAALAMRRWLQGFVYRVNLSLPTFVLSGAAALLVALLTVGYQAARAARADPIDSLRYE